MPNTTTAATLTVTYPYTDATVARVQCVECGKWERADNGRVRHSKNCDSKPQFAAPVAADALRTFADAVRATSLTHGRDSDVLDAVRKGYLSESDAMNTDD